MINELQELKRVIESVSGIKDISTRKRTDDYKLARALFYEYSINRFNCTLALTGSIVKRDHACVHNALKQDYDKHYPNYNLLKERVEDYYKSILFKNIGDTLQNQESTEQYFKKRILESETTIKSLKKEVQKLQDNLFKQREKVGGLKHFLDIPKEKQNDFIETRLKPYLKMHTNHV